MSGLSLPCGPTSAKVNNIAQGLDMPLYRPCDVEFLDITSPSGMRTYCRSLIFLLCKAADDLFPGIRVNMECTVSKGYYLVLKKDSPLKDDEIDRIKARMKELVAQDLPYVRKECPTEEAVELFEKKGNKSLVTLLRSIGNCYTTYHMLDTMPDYYYGTLLPSTGYLRLFDLIPFHNGVLLRVPSSSDPSRLEELVSQPKLLDILKEHHDWNNLLGMRNVGDFNIACQEGRTTDLINVSEALQEKKIAKIADDITKRGNVKVVLIAGPSSSGKTTFSKRLSVQLSVCGFKPYAISLDDYFVSRDRTPRDANGEYDYESLYSIDLEMFNEHMTTLLSGGEIELPRYDFIAGESRKSGKKLKLEDNMILILEGIHGLNPDLTPQIPNESTYRIYVSALTTIRLDEHNYIPTTDNRLLRRIIRDAKSRGCSAKDTIHRWPSVRRGEEKWIFPFQENADAIFNSALLFELAIIKDQALPALSKVKENEEEYSEARRLMMFLSYFYSLESLALPPTSLLREFIGGSTFEY